MTHVDLSGILLKQSLYDAFYAEVSAALSDGVLSFGELVSLGGSLANKVHQFESLSSQQKKDLLLTIVKNVVQKLLSEKPSLREKLDECVSFVQQVLPSVLNVVDVASKTALAKPVKNKTLGEFYELFHAMTCSSCLNVEVPLVVIKPKTSVQEETKVVATETAVVPVEPVPVKSTEDNLEKSESSNP
jgi:hypothetical protein